MRKTILTVVLTLLGTAILVALVAGVRWFVWARSTSASNACINNIRQLDSAVQQWALDTGKKDDSPVDPVAILKYVHGGGMPKCPYGGSYVLGKKVSDSPRCTLPEHGPDYQHVQVADEMGKPLGGVWVTVENHPEMTDSTTGVALAITNYQMSAMAIVVSKEGYETRRIELPVSWPLKVNLSRKTNDSKEVK